MVQQSNYVNMLFESMDYFYLISINAGSGGEYGIDPTTHLPSGISS